MFTTRFMPATFAVAASFSLAASAHAVTYFAEDMEHFDTSGGPVAITSATPTTNGGTWEKMGAHTVQAIADPTGAGKGNVLEYLDTDDATGGRISAVAGLNMTADIAAIIEFDLYI